MEKTQKPMGIPRMVGNVVVDWQQMAGETEDIRRLNSLLTSELVDPANMPDDECLEEAHQVMALYLANVDGSENWKHNVCSYLISQFAKDEQGNYLSTKMEKASKLIIGRIERVLTTGRWPDRPKHPVKVQLAGLWLTTHNY